MSAAKPKAKSGTSSVSKSSGGTASSSKSHPIPSSKSKGQTDTPASAMKESVVTPSTTEKPSKFYFACRNNEIDTVTSLLQKLTLDEINQIEPNGSTALHAAAYHGNEEIVKLLLSKGAQRMIKNIHGCTPFDEAKTNNIKKLFQRSEGDKRKSQNRFSGEKGPSFEWIFVKDDPSRYASFNRQSLFKCQSDEQFNFLCCGIRQHYINENGPLADEKGMDSVRLFIVKAIQDHDPTQVVRAYTAETGFYTRINKDLSQMPTHWSGIKYERNIASIFVFHPALQSLSFTGQTYRGMTMSSQDLNEYSVDSIFMNKTFLSTSKERTCVEIFAKPNGSSKQVGVICKYLIKHNGTALAIECLSEFPLEKEVLILPYASFRVKSIRKSNENNGITEIDIEEEDDQVKWTLKKSSQTSHAHTSMKKKMHGNNDDDDVYERMFKDSEEKGKIDPADLAKWKEQSFGIDPQTDTYAKIWNDAKKGKISKSDLMKWKQENGMINKDDDDSSDLQSYDGENNEHVFTASNYQSYAISKKSTSKNPLDMKEWMSKFENDSDD